MAPVIKPNAPMPTCGRADQQKIIDRIEGLSRISRRESEELLDVLGSKTLCQVLHGMRRWYTYNTGSAAWKVIPHVQELSEAMDLSPPVGAYRGFKVDVDDPLADSDECSCPL